MRKGLLVLYILCLSIAVEPALGQCNLPPLVFVHGGAGSGAQFESQALRFTSNGWQPECILLFEYNSSAYSGEETQILAKLTELINETSRNLGKPVLIGHSLGTRVIYNYTLRYPDYVEKIAKIILVDGISGVSAPNVPTLAIFGRPTSLRPPGANVTGAENVYIPNQTHVEVMTSAETFIEMYRFITGREPVSKYILPEKQIIFAGKLVYFPSNVGLETGILNIYELREDGFRKSREPVASFVISDGKWGPFEAKFGVRYEFEFVRENNLTMHFYREPFIRSDYWIRFLVSPPGGVAELASRSENHVNLLIIRYKEILTGLDQYIGAVDDLQIDGVSVCDPRICNVSKPVNGPTGLWIFDNNSDGQSQLYPPHPYYHSLPFQTGIDYYIPAGSDRSINVTIFARNGGVQTIKVPNWKSSDHRVVLQFNDYVQSYRYEDFEIIVPNYANPFAINVSRMPSLTSLPIDDPNDGIDWIKIDLPHECKSGFGNDTFIMVRRGNENKLLIYLEGGGACSNFRSCDPTETGGSGTVISLDPKFDTGPRPLKERYKNGIFNVTNPLNPFRNWTIVFVPYSTGDIYMGNRVVMYFNQSNPEESKLIYHTGYVNAIAAMKWIKEKGSEFDKIVISGTSAGGFGTIIHFYTAYQIFNRAVITINDAGPGTAPNVTSSLETGATAQRWGSYQNFPQESLGYFYNTDTLRFLNWGLNECSNCIYALFEDQWDFVIGPYFQGYSFPDYQARLLNLLQSIKANFSDRFCYYLPLSTYHTVLAGGYLYPFGDRFYVLNIDGYYVRQWINDILNGNCRDSIDRGLRDLQAEILTAPTKALANETSNASIRIKNVGVNATPDPFLVTFSVDDRLVYQRVLSLTGGGEQVLNFSFIPSNVAGVYNFSVRIDPAVPPLYPLGSVVELGGLAAEQNNTHNITLSVCQLSLPHNVTIKDWLTPYDIALGMLPNATVKLPDGTIVNIEINWTNITDPVYPSFVYKPYSSASAPPYKAFGKLQNVPENVENVCPITNGMEVTTNVIVQTPLLPGLYPDAGIYPDGRKLDITDRTLFNQPGTYGKVEIQIDGLNRTYYYYIPSSYNPLNPMPMVLVFHGGGSRGLAEMLAVDDYAEGNSFILVTPDAYSWRWNRSLDIPFVSKIIEDMKRSYNISRVYAAGISMGGMMTTWVIYDLYDEISAAAIVSGSRELVNLLNSGNQPKPMTIVITAGTEERVLGNPIYEHLNARSAVEKLITIFNCNVIPKVKFWPEDESDPYTNVTRYVYECPNNVKVVYFEIGRGGHAWPGGLQYSIPSSIGWVTQHVKAWDAGEGIWSYLNASIKITPWQIYDKNVDGKIQDLELLNAIMDWLDGKLSDLDLINVILKWLQG